MARKTGVLMLLLMLLAVAHAREAYVVAAGGIAALVDDRGVELPLPEGVESVFAVGDGLFAAGCEGDFGLYDADGALVTGERFEMIEASGDALLYRKNGMYGAMAEDGQRLISPEWSQLSNAGDGRFLALSGAAYDGQADEMISVSADGGRIPTGIFTIDGLRPYREGLMAYMAADGLCGYVDADGREIISPQWPFAGDFEEGAAVVSDGEGMGLIDARGNTIVTLDYAWIRRGNGLIAAITDDGLLDVYSQDGVEKLFTADVLARGAEVCGSYVVLRDEMSAILYRRDGEYLYTAAGSALFFEGLRGQIIASDGSWGEECQYIINPDGSASEGRYQRLLPLCSDRYAFLTWVSHADGVDDDPDDDDTRYGLLDADGHTILPAEYCEILPAGEDRLVLLTESAVIFSDLDGRPLRRWVRTK